MNFPSLFVAAVFSLCGASVLSAQAPNSAAPIDPAVQANVSRSLARSLSEKTGRVVFKSGYFPDGSNPSTFIGVDEASGDRIIKAAGELEIESDRLNLKMEDLLFNTTSGQLVAKTDVEVDTEGIEAWSDELIYATESKGITLSYLPNAYAANTARVAKPAVLLDSPDKKMTFNRMDQFQVVPDAAGRTIYVNGSQLIEITMDEKAASAADAGSISKLGNSLKITVSSRDGQAASTTAQLLETGGVSSLRMLGSIRLLSDEFNIRADEMIYNAQNNTFEAIGNVYITQESFEADCGQMVYDLLTGKIRLSSNPYVVYLDEKDKVELKNFDVIVIEPSGGKVPNVIPEGGRGETIMNDRAGNS